MTHICDEDGEYDANCPACMAAMTERMEDARRGWVPGEQTLRDQYGHDPALLYRAMKGRAT